MPDSETEAVVREQVSLALRTGFFDHEAILAFAAQVAEAEEGDQDLMARVPSIVSQLTTSHLESARSWPAVTDCDRLDAAFDELNARGIMARHHWYCCQNCAHEAMPDEYDRVKTLLRRPRGYVFYHQQDAERAAEGGPLFLAFETWNYKKLPQTDIGRETVEVLAKHSLKTTWDGSESRRIQVNLTWQRRARPDRWCEGVGLGC